MASLHFVVPGSLATRTGGYIYDRRVIDGLRGRGWTVEVIELDASFPKPTGAALEGATRALEGIRDRGVVVIDSLAFGAMPDQIEREAGRLRIVPLVHSLLAADVGTDPATAEQFAASEERAFRYAALVVVAGPSAIGQLASYEVHPDRIAVVEPGTDRAPLARGSGGSRLQLLSVGTLSPGKGHELLVRALAGVPSRDWHLTCAGSLDRYPATVDRLRAVIEDQGLQPHVSLAGELSDNAVSACYDAADLFVLATLAETYPLSVAEALARGLPVVSTTVGSIPEQVGPDAGLLVPPGDVPALREALTRVITDDRLRARLTDGARGVRDRLSTWDEAVGKMAAVLDRVSAA